MVINLIVITQVAPDFQCNGACDRFVATVIRFVRRALTVQLGGFIYSAQHVCSSIKLWTISMVVKLVVLAPPRLSVNCSITVSLNSLALA
jgi:hypothetical protein